MHYTIAEAVRDTIQAMIWSPEETVIRKELARLEHDPAELCIVSLEGEQRETGDAFGGSKFREYDVRITLVRSSKMELQTDVLTIPEFMELIRNELHGDNGTELLGVSEVWDIAIKPMPSQQGGSTNSGYDRTTLVMTYKTCEAV